MTRIIRVGAAMASVAVFALAGCGSSSKSSSTTAAATTVAAATTAAPATTAAGGTATTAAGGSGENIAIQDFKYTIPTDLKAGATVTIVNGDSATHTFTDKGGAFDVRVDGSGGQGTLTVPAAGTYQIICKIHSSMSATLTVT